MSSWKIFFTPAGRPAEALGTWGSPGNGETSYDAEERLGIVKPHLKTRIGCRVARFLRRAMDMLRVIRTKVGPPGGWKRGPKTHSMRLIPRGRTAKPSSPTGNR